MKPKIAVIIPIYNRALIYKSTIDSIINQTYSNWECIIVDDHSTDSTFDDVKNYTKDDNRFIVLKRPIKSKKGPSACRNFGVKNSTADYIVFLDSDDYFTINCLENRVKFALINPKNDLWIFKTNYYNKITNNSEILFNKPINIYSVENYLQYFLNDNIPFCVSGPMWKKEIITNLNGFDENLFVLEDPDMHIRAFESNIQTATCTSCNFDHLYVVGNDKILNYKIIAENYFYFCKKHILKHKGKIINHLYSGIKCSIVSKNIFLLIGFIFLLLKHRLVSIKIVIGTLILFFINFLGLKDIKGFGYYRLLKFILNN
jgi:glycosyltransferase involved in cell wall biosynthesis